MSISKEQAEWAKGDMRLISGLEVIEKVAEMARNGQHCMIAPSHVKLVKSNILAALPWKNDWRAVKRLLNGYDIPCRTVLRYDAEGPGDTDAEMRAYRLRTHAMRFILRRYIHDPIGLCLNHYCDPVAVKASIKQLYGSTRDTLKTQGVLIYPFGNWFQPGTELFAKEDVMADGGAAFEGTDDRVKYDAGVKRGNAQLAIKFKAPVLPIYTTYKDNQWLIIVDDLIPVGAAKDSLELTHIWLERLAAMKARIWG